MKSYSIVCLLQLARILTSYDYRSEVKEVIRNFFSAIKNDGMGKTYAPWRNLITSTPIRAVDDDGRWYYRQ